MSVSNSTIKEISKSIIKGNGVSNMVATINGQSLDNANLKMRKNTAKELQFHFENKIPLQ